MRILYISQYYPPEMGAPSARVSELAREWSQAGHQVTVLTAFPHHPHGSKRPEDRGVLMRKEFDGDVSVLRTYVYATRNEGFLRRVLSYLSFMVSAVLYGLIHTGKADVVIATSPQFFTAVAGRVLSWMKRAPFVFEVRDLWPESIVTVGAMKDGVAVRLLKCMASFLYRSADRIVTVGPGYKRRIVREYPVSERKIDVVTNGVDLERFRFREDDRDRVRHIHGWEDEQIVMYLGTHGMAHGLEFVLDAAERMLGRNDVRFVFVGDGAEKANLIRAAETRGLTNTTFLPPVGKEEVVSLYAAADVCLAPLRKVDLFTEVLPSKIFEVMGMKRPLVISVDGDAREVVEAAEAGLFAEPENVDELCLALERVLNDRRLAEEFGRNGRRHVERYFSRRVLATEYLYLLAALAGLSPIATSVPVRVPARQSQRAA